MKISIIVAVSENNIIGNDNDLVFRIPNDIKMFKDITNNSTVIMGRKTYESIGSPLPNRQNIIITRNLEYKIEGCDVRQSIENGLMISQYDNIFIIGGGQIYNQSLEMDIVDTIYLTRIHKKAEGDILFEFDETKYKEVERKPNFYEGVSYDFIKYKKIYK